MGRPSGQSDNSGPLGCSTRCLSSADSEITAAAPLSSTMCARSPAVSSGFTGTGTSPVRSAAPTTATTQACRYAASAGGNRCSGVTIATRSPARRPFAYRPPAAAALIRWY